jgi:hypothetical protein
VEVKKTLAFGSGRFTPQVGGAGALKIFKEFTPSGLMGQAEWWVKTVSRKVNKMEDSFREGGKVARQ